MSIVQVKDVSKVYRQGDIEVHALSHLSLNIDKGAFIALAGPSGSGKTTLLNLIGGLDRPSAGSIVVDGTSLSDMEGTALAQMRRDQIGFIFQSYNLIPVLNAMENAELVLLLQGVEKQERERRVRALLTEVGLDGYERRFPHEMSGGQQQRVAVARAIVSEPSIVLADEPTANLDSKTAEALLETMQRMNREKGITFIFSTHDQLVMKYAGTLVMLKDGRVDAIRGDHVDQVTSPIQEA